MTIMASMSKSCSKSTAEDTGICFPEKENVVDGAKFIIWKAKNLLENNPVWL